MLTLTIGKDTRDVARGTLTLPRVGNWIANLTVNADGPATGSAVATLDGVDMPCHIQKAEMVAGMLDLRLVGGNGGLGKSAQRNHYKGATVRHTFVDLVQGAGEVPSLKASDAAVLNQPLPAWTSLAIPTGELLQALADTAAELLGQDVSWRVLYDGTVWIGAETWPACPADVRILDIDAANSSQLLGTDALGIWPGTTIGNRRIDSVVHQVGGNNRSTVYWAEAHL
jgi:hypothetical protein